MLPLRQFFNKSMHYQGSDEQYNYEVWRLAELAGNKPVDGQLMAGYYTIERRDVEDAWKHIQQKERAPKP